MRLSLKNISVLGLLWIMPACIHAQDEIPVLEENIIYTIPSPLEVATVCKKKNFKVEKINPNTYPATETDQQKNLIYYSFLRTDLSFAVVNKSKEAEKDFKNLETFTRKAKIQPYPLAAAIAGLYNANKDTLVEKLNELFYTIDTYLEDNDRKTEAFQVQWYSWIEVMHLVCNAEFFKNESTKHEEFIAEQKHVFENMKALSKQVELTEEMKSDVQKLDQIFSSMKINETAKVEVKTEKIIFIGGSNVEYTQQNLADIKSTIEQLKTKYLK